MKEIQSLPARPWFLGVRSCVLIEDIVLCVVHKLRQVPPGPLRALCHVAYAKQPALLDPMRLPRFVVVGEC